MPKHSPRSVPILTTDKQTEDFLAQDLSALDFAQFKPLRKPAQPAKP